MFLLLQQVLVIPVYSPSFERNRYKVIPCSCICIIAKRVLRGGIDAIIAEGTESGGHVGDITTMALH